LPATIIPNIIGSLRSSILTLIDALSYPDCRATAFRGKRGGLVKLLWFDGQGMCLFSKRLERGHFVWPVTNTGRVSLSPAQLSMLLEGIDWRMPQRVHRPELAG
jgi:transposase